MFPWTLYLTLFFSKCRWAFYSPASSHGWDSATTCLCAEKSLLKLLLLRKLLCQSPASSWCVRCYVCDHGEGTGSAGGSEEWRSSAGSQASLQSQVQQNKWVQSFQRQGELAFKWCCVCLAVRAWECNCLQCNVELLKQSYCNRLLLLSFPSAYSVE